MGVSISGYVTAWAISKLAKLEFIRGLAWLALSQRISIWNDREQTILYHSSFPSLLPSPLFLYG